MENVITLLYDLEPPKPFKQCPKQYSFLYCEGCNEFIEKKVPHPGGSSFHTVTKGICGLGYWEENFY